MWPSYFQRWFSTWPIVCMWYETFHLPRKQWLADCSFLSDHQAINRASHASIFLSRAPNFQETTHLWLILQVWVDSPAAVRGRVMWYISLLVWWVACQASSLIRWFWVRITSPAVHKRMVSLMKDWHFLEVLLEENSAHRRVGEGGWKFFSIERYLPKI